MKTNVVTGLGHEINLYKAYKKIHGKLPLSRRGEALRSLKNGQVRKSN